MRAGGALLAAFLLAAAPASASELPRKILALYDKSLIPGDYKDIAFTETHLFAEMPLNHLGMDLVYRDIREPLPEPGSLRGYRGVLAWFTSGSAVPDPDAYCRWLGGIMDAGLKVVVLGDPAVFPAGSADDARPSAACGRAFERLGLELGTVARPEPGFLKVERKVSRMVEFERRLDMREFPVFRASRALPGARSLLRIGSNVDEAFIAEPVVLSARGGAALHPFALYSYRLPRQKRERAGYRKVLELSRELGEEQFRWRIDPFAFFESAFGLAGWPRPDAATLNGRRILYAQVDGDGFFNVSEKDHKSLSAEVFLHEFLESEPSLPFSVGLITGYYDIPRFGTKRALELSRRIFALPNVEPASHGYAHPMTWHKGAVGLDVPGYRYSAAKEIAGSLSFINSRLAPKEKKAVLFQWTGDCLPDPGAVALADEKGYLNMNGGDARFDKRFPSVGFVAPLSRPLDGARQIYSSGSNENTYTNLWLGPYYGYREAVETFERTESPRRLKPVDIYVHFYSAEKIAAIRALHSVLRWAAERPLHPMLASEFARTVEDFFRMRIYSLGEGRYRFEGGSALRTIRFDGESRTPDMTLSKGVLGYKREHGSLYVHLGEGETRELVLAAEPPAVPHLREADFRITRWRAGPDGIRLRKRGWRKGEMVLGGLGRGERYRVREGGAGWIVRSRPDGTLTVRFRKAEGFGPPSEVGISRAP